MVTSGLVAIMVTAAITTIITTIVRWLLDSIKNSPIATKIEAVTRTTFAKSVLTLSWNILCFIMLVWALISEVLKKGSPTRLEVLYIAGLAVFAFLSLMLIASESGRMSYSRQVRKIQQQRMLGSTKPSS